MQPSSKDLRKFGLVLAGLTVVFFGVLLPWLWRSALPWPKAAERYRAALPNADWVVLDGVGHCPQLDVPLEAAELILGFTG